MDPQIIFTDQAPKPIGPYSQAVECNGLVFISGQIPLDPATGEVVGSTVAQQAPVVLHNLKAILRASGLSTRSLVKTTVFLRDMKAFGDFNAVYETELEGAKPARSVVEVSALPRGVLVEVEAVACR